MVEPEELRKMVMVFRVSELQTLLGFAGQNRTGRKPELQARALGLLRQKSVPIQMKICEIYKTIQHENHTLVNAQSGQGTSGASTSNGAAANNSSALNNPGNMVQRYQQPRLPMMNCPPPARAAYLHQPAYQAPLPPPPRNVLPGPMYSYQNNVNVPSVPYAVSWSEYNLPAHPGVVFKSLPFYDKLVDLVKPSSLISQIQRSRTSEVTFTFCLTPEQATQIAMNRTLIANSKFEYEIQVQVRFGLLDTTTEQDDLFPPGILLRMNNKPCQLPPSAVPPNAQGAEVKRTSKPLNVTNYVKISPTVQNEITISWTTDFNKGFVVGVGLVRKIVAKELLLRIRKDRVKDAKFTADIIRDKLKEDGDSDLATTVLRISLICPLGKKRIVNPCRSSTCTHLQCFDAFSYLEMNEVKPRWQCPVCNKPGLYVNLFIDSYFEEILLSKTLPADHTEVKLLKDGSWSVLTPEDELHRANSPCAKGSTVVIDADDGNAMECDSVKESKDDAVVVLTLSDSEDDENQENFKLEVDPSPSRDTEVIKKNPNSSLNLNIINLDSPSPPPSTSNTGEDIAMSVSDEQAS